MRYILTGFTQDLGFRVFSFEGVTDDRARTAFTVRADLALMRKYGIRTQELSLLCRGVLERRVESDANRTLTYTEEDMCLHSSACNAAREAAAAKKKAPRRPPNENLGAAWRSPQAQLDARREPLP